MKFSTIKVSGTIIFTILLTICAYSQRVYREGFIINAKRDTLHGYINMMGSVHDPKFKFKSTPEADASDITPEEISVVVIKNYRYFKSILIDADDKFAQTLVEGEINLYLHEKKFYLYKDNKLILLDIEKIEMEDADKGIAVHNKKNYIGTLKSSMSDCPKIWPAIDKSRLAESNLTDIVADYNVCKNVTPLVFKKEIPMFKLTVSPFVAWSYSDINIEVDDQFMGVFGYLTPANLSSFTISPGVGVNLSSPRVDDRFSFYTELRYVNISASDRYIYSKSSYDDNEIILNAKYIYLPITAQYDIPMTINNSLYLKGGLLKTFLLDADLTINRRVSSSPNTPPLVSQDRFDFVSQTGFTFSLGYKLKVTRKINGWIEARFDNTGPMINSGNVGLPNNVYSLVTAFSF